jgi:hypothetical protein
MGKGRLSVAKRQIWDPFPGEPADADTGPPVKLEKYSFVVCANTQAELRDT